MRCACGRGRGGRGEVCVGRGWGGAGVCANIRGGGGEKHQ